LSFFTRSISLSSILVFSTRLQSRLLLYLRRFSPTGLSSGYLQEDCRSVACLWAYWSLLWSLSSHRIIKNALESALSSFILVFPIMYSPRVPPGFNMNGNYADNNGANANANGRALPRMEVLQQEYQFIKDMETRRHDFIEVHDTRVLFGDTMLTSLDLNASYTEPDFREG
jgi:hypothetical protein